jgi:hypothetical protein
MSFGARRRSGPLRGPGSYPSGGCLDIDRSLRAVSARAVRHGHLGLRRRHRGRERRAPRRPHHPSCPRPIRVDPDRWLLGGHHFRVDPRWRSRSVVRGPLGLYGHPLDIRKADRWGPSAFWTKIPVILAGQRPVTLKVASRDRHRVGLTYGPGPSSPASSRNGARGLAAAPRAVRFVSCPRRAVTAWPGGLALADRQPRIRFEVRVEGQGWRSLSLPDRG